MEDDINDTASNPAIDEHLPVAGEVPESDTQVPQDVIDERFEQLYEAQKEIARELNQEFLGKIIEVLVEGQHEETDLLLQGRHAGQAPDIDGKVIINDGFAKAGDIVKVEITEVLDYDLVGRIVTV